MTNGTRTGFTLIALACLATRHGAAAQAPTKNLALTLHGAAQQVGRSCFLLEADGGKAVGHCRDTGLRRISKGGTHGRVQ